MIQRAIAEKATQLASAFPVLTVTGPRQSGKSTLVKELFPELPYVLLEDPDVRLFAQQDPRRFLATYPDGAIFDEVQRVPELFSYLQGVVDQQPAPRHPYVLTGSQNFLLLESIGQTLAGRTAVLKLLPLSYPELQSSNRPPNTLDELMLRGGYPRLSNVTLAPADFYPSYIQTYLERDVRSVQAIQDLSAFVRFMKLCAGRVGSILNLSSLASIAAWP